MIRVGILLLCLFTISGCAERQSATLARLTDQSKGISGKKAYLDSPYLTAGNRVYMVGHQNGAFPELGWHITGEMGGIWNHPIKLMDGFKISVGPNETPLTNATEFINYPFSNRHRFELPEEEVQIDQWQFVPDNKEGLVVQLLVQNTSTKPKELSLNFDAYSDLRPTWLGERTNMADGQDLASFNETIDGWVVEDDSSSWSVVVGSNLSSVSRDTGSTPYKGKGAATRLSYTLNLEAQSTETVQFYIAGSYQSTSESLRTFTDIKSNYLSYYTQKKERYNQLAGYSKLSIPDSTLQQTFEWLKYNSDWLVRTVPEIGTGITAGIPDYPWWFGVDSEYALKGYMAVGQKEPVYQTIALLDSLSEAVNGNGRIVHETSTNGATFNEGNINETPQFASLIWEIYKWNGDRAFLERYFPTIQKGLSWLMREKDQNRNLFPDGFGMMEIHGMDSEMIDVAAYTQRAFADAARIAQALNKDILARKYRNIAEQLKTRINAEFWSEEYNSYADFIGSDAQALRLIDDAIVRADTLNKPWAVKELKATRDYIKRTPSKELRPFVLHHNWVVNTPMEMGIADTARALRALTTAEKFTNPFGVFVTGIDRDEAAAEEDGSFKGSKAFSYTGAVMTLPTGVQAVAENNYGRPDKALDYLKRMSRSFSFAFPGSMYEVSPDYGMIAQAWNIYSFAIPIVQQFFGIQPDAANKVVTIVPQMPSDWDKASLEQVQVADNAVSVYYSETSSELEIKVTQTAPGWTLVLELPGTHRGKSWAVEESSIAPKSTQSRHVFHSRDSELTVKLKAL